MLKRINWKAVFIAFAWVVSLAGVVALMSFIEIKKNEAKCNDIKVIIPGIESFIDRKEVDLIIQKTTGTLIGKLLHEVDVHKIEEALMANPYIQSAKVYAEMDGVVNVKISQREPVLRILNASGQDFYVDKEGFKLPLSLSFVPNVVAANGFILENFSGKVDTLKTEVAKGLYNIAMFIRKDTLWNEQIEQLYVNDKREIEMIPRVGDHRIVLGEADSLDTKFKNLLVFYKKALPNVGWDAYKTINIKYANQIVCEKRIIDSTAIKKSPVAIKPATDTIKTIQDTLTTAATQ
jgi:cell division protein FtsQ